MKKSYISIIIIIIVLIIVLSLYFIFFNKKEETDEPKGQKEKSTTITYNCKLEEPKNELKTFVDNKFYLDEDNGTTQNTHQYKIEYNKKVDAINTNYQLTIKYSKKEGYNSVVDSKQFMNGLDAVIKEDEKKLTRTFTWEGLQIVQIPNDRSSENWLEQYVSEIETKGYSCKLKK